MVLIPKGGGDYRSIGLMQIMWKAVAVILNRCFAASITYHNSLHGLWAGRGTGTATLKVKIFHKIKSTREEFLHAIFQDLRKSYNALERSMCPYILEGYGMGIRSLRLLCRYWEMLQMVARTRGYYGETFYGENVVMKGDPLLSTIFNVVVDAVVRHWESLVMERAGGDIINNDPEQPAGRMIRESDNERRRMKKGNMQLKVNTEFFYA